MYQLPFKMLRGQDLSPLHEKSLFFQSLDSLNVRIYQRCLSFWLICKNYHLHRVISWHLHDRQQKLELGASLQCDSRLLDWAFLTFMRSVFPWASSCLRFQTCLASSDCDNSHRHPSSIDLARLPTPATCSFIRQPSDGSTPPSCLSWNGPRFATWARGFGARSVSPCLKVWACLFGSLPLHWQSNLSNCDRRVCDPA